MSFDLSHYEPEALALLRRKYQGVTFDVVVPLGESALSFAERHRAELWPGVPLVFTSVSEGFTRSHTLGPGITGVTIAYDIDGTVDLAIRLQPSARRVVVVVGSSDSDRSWLSTP